MGVSSDWWLASKNHTKSLWPTKYTFECLFKVISIFWMMGQNFDCSKFRWDLKNIRPYTSVAINTLKMLFVWRHDRLIIEHQMPRNCQKMSVLSSARNWWYLYLLQNIIMSHDDAFALCIFLHIWFLTFWPNLQNLG